MRNCKNLCNFLHNCKKLCTILGIKNVNKLKQGESFTNKKKKCFNMSLT